MAVCRRRSLGFKALVTIPLVWVTLLLFFFVDQQVTRLEKLETGRRGGIVQRLMRGSGVDSLPARLPKTATGSGPADDPPVGEQRGFLLPPQEPSGPGEMGKPVIVVKDKLSKEDKEAMEKGWSSNAFNQYVSDQISVHRTLPDVRDDKCRESRFSRHLPDTAVIICFHNEAWSTLVRTVHSVLDRSPAHLLTELILVDDFSSHEYLGKRLSDYMSQYPRVKIVRTQKREGLIRARLLGASHANADVLTYLDSHCECTEGWLEPLLDRIARNRTTVVCPVIDVINDDTFEYHWQRASGTSVGGFDWNLQFNWHAIPERERKLHSHPSEPVATPTMAGGLFAIDRRWFEKLGSYDPAFDIWGGENLELSFKVWMCGGRLEIVPCSHVGHIFRKRSPYKWRSGVNVLRRNSVRLAEVWMDEYKNYFYDRINHELGDYGDVSSRRALRQRLQCKSFKWYLDNVFPELFVPGEAAAFGEIRNLQTKLCVDSQCDSVNDMYKPVGLYMCHNLGGNQYWLMSKDGEIRRDEACLDYAGTNVTLYPCHGSRGNQFWIYNPKKNFIHHGSSNKCMGVSEDRKYVTMEQCDDNNPRIRWVFANFDETKLRNSTNIR
ncbi:putative polypeptide N-acetylgalactosaminyltransferase 9 isoform X1 [Amphibalanus amphitrite]|uniref:putative polypeptide N-acetylgalactosaminyltransferase 9 isoform X1 n=1 Tax=Amphibalanus amphitrite TaxID=1232801 RepID=UPI001C912A76|nr:putative polypeptide N-acetylgalactosaminyltransferase 9 isoform X1 [Amphibalanus amphitrite]XP_043227649.1 putative polypeptide N-acetylgalactosaminyltransferase 9 isoform X1 [Amphibalanus amphitrite]XP_043227650.1 putative polypeptide N-acetylgalactosaminyltransferase 9 isoform X1 [Amphibalanus amphitrite]